MRYYLLLFVAILGGMATVQSQEYLGMIEQGTYSVQEIVDNAEIYFENKDKGRGSGYKQFKRWEYNAKRLQNEDGYLRSVSEDLAELERYNAYLNNTAHNRVTLTDNWQELGPQNWNATSSWNPGVGRITGIAVDKTNSDHIIVGANTGGVWKTTDAGQTWTPLNDYFTNLKVYSVAIDPSNSDTYYFGSTDGFLFRSTDAGATWTQIADLGSADVNKILIHPTDSDIIFASGGGVWRTVDGGANWTQPLFGGYDIEFKPGDPSTVYATGNNFFKSTDGGANFSAGSGFGTGPKMMGVSPADPTVVYVLEASSGSFGGFYKSTNSGDSFTELDHTGRNYFGYDTAGFSSGGQAPRDMDVAVNPTNIDEVHIAGVLTWRSLDGGVSFTCTADWIPGNAASAGIGYCHADVDILEFDGTTLFAGTDGGIFKAENTLTLDENYYEDITTGMGIRQFYKIGVSQTPSVVITGGSQDNGSSFYNETSGWRDWIGADGMEGMVDKDAATTMYGMIQFGGLYRSMNGGISVTGLSGPGGSGDWVSPMEQDPSVTNTIYVGYDAVHKSTDRGNTWAQISQIFTGDLSNLKIAPNNNQIMYASRSAFIYKTEDGGATNWTQLATPGGLINSIAIHPTNPNKIAVATSGTFKVYVSNDGGATWDSYLHNLPAFSALSVIWDDNGADALYLGMDYGIYYIDNTFSEWQPYNNNIPNVIINEFDINHTTGMIYAGTYGRGLWVSPVGRPGLGISDLFSENDLKLYPNPAGDQISISLPRTVEADIRVFSVLGKLMIYEANQTVSNNYTLSLSSLASGMYFIRINSENGTVTKQFIKE
ncbi:T9SS type A sorting domain-containing protein [Ulvibacter antarcticus]|uniref:Putative secreted protein (Por secretion system target) n=1 Tax=Ulvibacter antarcticus TaxID=442714 RepID=A0A3L9YCM0_9FLAO|nr:T9SS type A sorting domain-containing protein [Ulvibacter antarcticus]RMA58483.1 putative secreted protein (Por secretion system target) [Ulvibacter antarcticus]